MRRRSLCCWVMEGAMVRGATQTLFLPTAMMGWFCVVIGLCSNGKKGGSVGREEEVSERKVRMCQQCAIFPENSSSHADQQRYLLLIVPSKGLFVNHQRRLHREVQFCG